jgi:YbgC/YbaW family acyl-CoA thioester hydrolase
MEELNKVWETKHSIRFPDCDPFNHLNNSRYIDYFINAREDHLLKFHNFSVYDRLRDKGLSWVIGKNEIVYIRPALLMETVLIQSMLLKIDERTILVEMSMWDDQKTAMKALLWTTFVHYNLKTQRPEKHEPEFIETFKPYENPLPGALSIDDRAKQLRKAANPA